MDLNQSLPMMAFLLEPNSGTYLLCKIGDLTFHREDPFSSRDSQATGHSNSVKELKLASTMGLKGSSKEAIGSSLRKAMHSVDGLQLEGGRL